MNSAQWVKQNTQQKRSEISAEQRELMKNLKAPTIDDLEGFTKEEIKRFKELFKLWINERKQNEKK
jgi:hypothetical protein